MPVHLGTPEAALDRGFGYGRPYVHEFEYDGPIHPTAVTDAIANHVADITYKKTDPDHHDPYREEAHEDIRSQTPHTPEKFVPAMQRVFASGHALQYKNKVEDPGKTSIVVPDPTKIRYKKTHYLPGAGS